MKEMEILFRVSVLVFVIGGMLATGLSLSIWRILDPLKNTKRVILSLVANFVLVPVIVYGIVTVIPVSEGVRIGLILLSLSAGAPLLPKLVDIAKNSAAFAIGLMLLLMTVTIFYLPIVLPRLLTGIEVSSWAIAKPLIILMLTPLLVALFVKAHYEFLAKRLQPVFAKINNIALINSIFFDYSSSQKFNGPGWLWVVGRLSVIAGCNGSGLSSWYPGQGYTCRIVSRHGTAQYYCRDFGCNTRL